MKIIEQYSHLNGYEFLFVDKGGILVARVKPLGDLTNITRHERDRRLSELLKRVPKHFRRIGKSGESHSRKPGTLTAGGFINPPGACKEEVLATDKIISP